MPLRSEPHPDWHRPACRVCYDRRVSAPRAKAVKGPRSSARLAFFENSDSVRSLWAIHQGAKEWAPAQRRHLGVANQGVYLLVAALWETYCEDLLFESVGHLVHGARGPEQLPLRLRRNIAAELREDRHDLAAWRLAGDGWRSEALEGARRLRETLVFHSPKASQVDSLFDRHLGMHRLSEAWPSHRDEPAAKALDAHLFRRGALAHRAGEVSVTKAEVSDFYQLTSSLTAPTDLAVGQHLASHTGKDPYAQSAAGTDSAAGHPEPRDPTAPDFGPD